MVLGDTNPAFWEGKQGLVTALLPPPPLSILQPLRSPHSPPSEPEALPRDSQSEVSRRPRSPPASRSHSPGMDRNRRQQPQPHLCRRSACAARLPPLYRHGMTGHAPLAASANGSAGHVRGVSPARRQRGTHAPSLGHAPWLRPRPLAAGAAPGAVNGSRGCVRAGPGSGAPPAPHLPGPGQHPRAPPQRSGSPPHPWGQPIAHVPVGKGTPAVSPRSPSLPWAEKAMRVPLGLGFDPPRLPGAVSVVAPARLDPSALAWDGDAAEPCCPAPGTDRTGAHA